jgi:hypothetical protein
MRESEAEIDEDLLRSPRAGNGLGMWYFVGVTVLRPDAIYRTGRRRKSSY